jgi:hypothetical protein
MARVQEATLQATALHRDADAPTVHDANRRRFTIASLIGLGAAAIPYLWVLWDGRLDPLRRYPGGFGTDFYDLQARALFHGYWDVPRGSLGIEGFIVGGKEYTYFPPLPSLLRMPVLAVTDSLDGRLTAPSMLLAWMVTGLFSVLLLWRVRVFLRGSAFLGRVEAASFALVLVTIMSGSVLLYLAWAPWVFHEAFAWGAAMVTAGLFALLGVLERPSTGRVVATGLFALGAMLSRTTIGWGCVIAVVLAAIWFASGRGGEDHRRWWLPLLVAGLVPFAVGCAITWMKFGTFFMHPLHAQVWTQVNAHRRHALAANGGGLLNIGFAPSTLFAYLRPDGLRLSAVYPFITMPATPARAVGNVVIDQTYRTASLPASTPLLFLLSIWGAFTVFRVRPIGHASLIRIPLLGAVAGAAGIFFYGYISTRYLGDLVPLVILASAVGLIDLWRRLETRKRKTRTGAIVCVAVLAVFGVVTNFAMTIQTRHLAAPGERVRSYIQRQQSVSDLTGDTLNDNIVRGDRLPRYAPADELFVMGKCSGLYISTGEHEFPRWLMVEAGPGLHHVFDVTYHEVDRGPIPLVTMGGDPPLTLWMQDRPVAYTRWLSFRVDGVPRRDVTSTWASIVPGRTYRISVLTDTELHRVSVSVNGHQYFTGRLRGSPPVIAHTMQPQPEGPAQPATVTERPVSVPRLCESLTSSKAAEQRTLSSARRLELKQEVTTREGRPNAVPMPLHVQQGVWPS